MDHVEISNFLKIYCPEHKELLENESLLKYLTDKEGIYAEEMLKWLAELSVSEKTKYLSAIECSREVFIYYLTVALMEMWYNIAFIKELAKGSDGSVNLRHFAELSKDPELIEMAGKQEKFPYIRENFVAPTGPNQMNETIIESVSRQTLIARYLIANYYRKKYGIEIFVILGRDDFVELIKSTPHLSSLGILSSAQWDLSESKASFQWFDSHSVPAIFSRPSPTSPMYLHFNDSIEARNEHMKKGSSGFVVSGSSIDYRRQANGGSCVAESLIQLKDGLRDPSYFKKLMLLESTDGTVRYEGPVASHKTTQISKTLSNSPCYLKEADTPTAPYGIAKGQSISQHRKKHTRRLRGILRGEEVFLSKNCYLLDKGSEFEDVIRAEYDSHTREELNHIYDLVSGRIALGRAPADGVCSLSPQENLIRAAKLGHTYEALELIKSGTVAIDLEVVKSAVEGGHLGTLKMLVKFAFANNSIGLEDFKSLASIAAEQVMRHKESCIRMPNDEEVEENYKMHVAAGEVNQAILDGRMKRARGDQLAAEARKDNRVKRRVKMAELVNDIIKCYTEYPEEFIAYCDPSSDTSEKMDRLISFVQDAHHRNIAKTYLSEGRVL